MFIRVHPWLIVLFGCFHYLGALAEKKLVGRRKRLPHRAVLFLDSDTVKGMKYPVALVPTEEGYSVSCPGLPGCWSQGATEEEALANIRDAIVEYLEVARN